MKSRPFLIHYHLNNDTNNRCWGNSLGFQCNARSLKEACNKFFRKNKYCSIYSIDAFHPTRELDYDATQQFLNFEGFFIDKE